MIERLDPRNDRDAHEIADLHTEYLADSPIVQFGPAFLRRFFYRTLIRDQLVGVSFYRHEGKIRGFISYTLEPLGFMHKGIRRHPLALGWSLISGVIQRPATARDIVKILRVMRERGEEHATEDMEHTAEVISLVVDEAYRGHVPEDGDKRLAVRLFDDAVAFFESHGMRHVHLMVKPDNLASNIFCASMGCEFGKISYGGEAIHRYTYHLPDAAAAGEASS